MITSSIMLKLLGSIKLCAPTLMMYNCSVLLYRIYSIIWELWYFDFVIWNFFHVFMPALSNAFATQTN